MTTENRRFSYKSLEGSWIKRKLTTIGFLGELYNMAYFDQDTNLPNKNYWNKFGPKMYDFVVNQQKDELCVAMLDFDYMKIWNDEQGHVKTDRLLYDFGKLMTMKVFGFRFGHDLVAKWGGDEFSIGMPYTTMNEAVTVCERVLKHLKGLSCKYIMEPTATIGIASSRMGFDNFSSVVEAADATLMKAKFNFRNKGRVYVYQP